MLTLLLKGAGLGLAAGISPGPLMTIVITESLRGGFGAGARIAFVPLITDSVLILVTALLMAPLPPWGLAAISLVGGLVMIWMGWESARARPPAAGEAMGAARLGKAVITNLLNPHAFLFWLTIGVPAMRLAMDNMGLTGPAVFLAGFFGIMVPVKVAVALGVSTGRQFLQGTGYRVALGLAGGILALMGLERIWEGIAGLGR